MTKTIENHIIVILRFPIYITFYPFNFLMYFSVLSMELIIIEQVPFKPYCFISRVNFISKVEKTLKGSLDLIPSPSPSVKIQIMGGKVCLRCKGKKFENKKFVDITQQCFAFTTHANFPVYNLNFH